MKQNNIVINVVVIIIFAIIFSICVVRICQIWFTLYFYYDYAIWCNPEDKAYIKSNGEINSDFDVAVCKVSWNKKERQSTVLKNMSSIFEKSQDIKYDGGISEYIRENNKKGEAVLKCSIPYILMGLFSTIVFYIIAKKQ